MWIIPGMSYRDLCEALLKGDPYTGPPLRALQGDPQRQRYFRPVVNATRQFLPSPLDILEIGSWAGVSTISWGVALTSSQVDGTITYVDPWLPYFDTAVNSTDVYREMNEAAERNLIYKLFEHNITSAGLHNVVHVKNGTSREVLPDLPAATWAIVYIDGSHMFEDVMFDLCQNPRSARSLLNYSSMLKRSTKSRANECCGSIRTAQKFFKGEFGALL